MSKIFVDEIAGIADANTVAIPGHVIQVVTGTFGLVNLNESTTFTDVADLTITPTSTTSKILVTFNFQMIWGAGAAGSNQGAGFRILRDSTTIREPAADGNGPYQFFRSSEFSYLRQLTTYNAADEPNTTSAVTYKLQGRIYIATAAVDYLTINESSTTSETGQITLMEIAG